MAAISCRSASSGPGLERVERTRLRPDPQRLHQGRRRGRRGGRGEGAPGEGRALPRRAPRGLLRDGPHPGRPPPSRRRLRQGVRAPRAAAARRAWTWSSTARGFGCEASHIVARKLKERGIPAAILHEGWPAWQDAHYPVREGRRAVRLLRRPALALVAGRAPRRGLRLREPRQDRAPRRLRPHRLSLPARRAERTIGPLPANLVAVTLPWVEVVAGLPADLRRLATRGGRRRGVFSSCLPGRRGLGAHSAASTSRTAAASPSPARARAGVQLLLGDLALLAAALILATVERRASGPLTTPRNPHSIPPRRFLTEAEIPLIRTM